MLILKDDYLQNTMCENLCSQDQMYCIHLETEYYNKLTRDWTIQCYERSILLQKNLSGKRLRGRIYIWWENVVKIT